MEQNNNLEAHNMFEALMLFGFLTAALSQLIPRRTATVIK